MIKFYKNSMRTSTVGTILYHIKSKWFYVRNQASATYLVFSGSFKNASALLSKFDPKFAHNLL